MELNEALDQIPGIIYWKTLDGLYAKCSRAFSDVCGIKTPTKIIDLPEQDLYTLSCNKDNLCQLTKYDETILKKNDFPYFSDCYLKHPNKNIKRYFTIKTPWVNKHQELIGLISLSINLFHYYSLYEQIITVSPGHVFWKDLHARYLGCNQEFLNTLQLTSIAEIIGKSDHDLLTTSQAEKIIAIDTKVISEEIEIITEEVAKDKQGNTAVYFTKKMPMYDANNKVCGLIGTAIDITDSKRLALKQAELLSYITHDMRSSFSGIYTMLQVLQQNETDFLKRERLSSMLTAGQQLLTLMNEILIAAKRDSQPKCEPFNIQILIHNVIQLFDAQLKMKAITLRVICASKFIVTNQLYLKRILINLLSNAIKSTTTGSIIIRVKLVRYLQLLIIDSGQGMSIEQVKTIKTQLRNGAHSQSHEDGDNLHGFGMTIIGGLVQALQGDIYVKSCLQRGTVFRVKLPLLT
ncbi:MAG: hypothetical protein Tsb005_14360 [Gammaproteobacteria bacterium]